MCGQAQSRDVQRFLTLACQAPRHPRPPTCPLPTPQAHLSSTSCTARSLHSKAMAASPTLGALTRAESTGVSPERAISSTPRSYSPHVWFAASTNHSDIRLTTNSLGRGELGRGKGEGGRGTGEWGRGEGGGGFVRREWPGRRAAAVGWGWWRRAEGARRKGLRPSGLCVGGLQEGVPGAPWFPLRRVCSAQCCLFRWASPPAPHPRQSLHARAPLRRGFAGATAAVAPATTPAR